MFPKTCAYGAAENGQEERRYYVRLPKDKATLFEGAELLSEEEGVCRLLTAPVSVLKMHETAKALREAGEAVFFASVRG